MLLTAREQVIASVCSDLFWCWMAREPASRIPLDDESANALLITCLCNRQIGFRAAEAIVPELKRRSGISSTLELFTSHNDIMLEFLMFDPSLGKSVHRFHYFARYCHDAMVHIRDKYDGSALNMFADTPLGSEALRRITAIRGFGTKTGSLWLRLCCLTYSGCELHDGYQGIMPADDRWVRRVGSQLGLWEEDAKFEKICEVATRLSFCCPVEIDALFIIGTDWQCGTVNQMCNGNPEGVECPMRRACPTGRLF